AARTDAALTLRTEPWMRALVDFSFPSEPAWANEDLETALASKNFQQQERMAAGLLASTNDFSLALRFIERATIWMAIPYVCDLVLGFEPEQAWRLLDCLFKRIRESGVRHRPFAGAMSRAVAALKGEPPARLFAPLLLERGVGPVGASYFRQWRDLA